MRRKPEHQRPSGVRLPHEPLPPRTASEQGDSIEPFLVSGGAGWFLTGMVFDPRVAGVQLVRSLYVPFGKTGFLKQLRVAPFMPPVFVDPWETSGVNNTVTSWRVFPGVAPTRPGGRNCVWETPFGWESYFDSGDPASFPPQWTWQLRLLQGNIADIRRTRPPFNIADPLSWYLVEDIAVPASAYEGGLPGAAPSGFWTPERMQVIQGDELTTHVMIPQNTTLCLFTSWLQGLVQPMAGFDGEAPTANYGAPEYPLLPSFGQLHGYVQSADRESSTENARYGWGG